VSRFRPVALAVVAGAALLQAAPLLGQTTPTYDRYSLLWLAYIGDHAIAHRVSLIGDVQLRRTDFGAEPQQLLARAGLLADVGPGVRAGGGYAYTLSYDYGDFTPDATVPEHRIWQQLNLSQKSNKVAFLHRFRLEERWLGLQDAADTDAKDWTFQWRVRYMLRTTLPLHGAPDKSGHLYAVGSDELFVKWGASQPTNLFDQNRLQLGIGVGLAKQLRLEATWLNLQLLRGDGSKRESGNGLLLALMSNASLR
jgi:hypothetical protein